MEQTTCAYVHEEGIHCESACQRNILAAHGLAVDEDVLFGLDGGFGFSYFASAGPEPDIVVGKQSILPLQATRLMGVEVKAHTPRTTAGLVKLLDLASAVLTRVDIGQLPHWGLDSRSAFGGYFVNAIAYDERTDEITCAMPELAVIGLSWGSRLGVHGRPPCLPVHGPVSRPLRHCHRRPGPPQVPQGLRRPCIDNLTGVSRRTLRRCAESLNATVPRRR